MKTFNGMSTEGLQRLMQELYSGVLVNDLDKLVLDTRSRIIREWTGYTPGLKMALKVFDGLCQRDLEVEIARKHTVSRQVVSLTKRNLIKMPCMKEFRRRIKALQRDS